MIVQHHCVACSVCDVSDWQKHDWNWNDNGNITRIHTRNTNTSMELALWLMYDWFSACMDGVWWANNQMNVCFRKAHLSISSRLCESRAALSLAAYIHRDDLVRWQTATLSMDVFVCVCVIALQRNERSPTRYELYIAWQTPHREKRIRANERGTVRLKARPKASTRASLKASEQVEPRANEWARDYKKNDEPDNEYNEKKNAYDIQCERSQRAQWQELRHFLFLH